MHAESQRESLTHLLSGVFAYSYSGYHVAEGTPPHGAPEIGSYLERTRPATTVVGRRGWELYDEIDGYVLIDYIGWIDFHGDGFLSGGGTAQRAGGRAVPFTHSGTYTVENALVPMRTGGAYRRLERDLHPRARGARRGKRAEVHGARRQ